MWQTQTRRAYRRVTSLGCTTNSRCRPRNHWFDLQIQFRILDDGEDFYFLDCLMGWKATAISTMTAGEGNQSPHPFKTTKLDVNNFFIKGGQEYDIVIACEATL